MVPPDEAESLTKHIPCSSAFWPKNANDIPFMQEFLDLLGDTRFRTLRIQCLCLEGLQRLGFTKIPWKEPDARKLLNTLPDREVTPHKLQSTWNTFKCFSAKFGVSVH